MPINAVIFDRDGVLADYDIEGYQNAVEQLGPLRVDVHLTPLWYQLLEKKGAPSNLAEEKIFWRTFWDSLSDKLDLSKEVREALYRFDYIRWFRPFPEVLSALRLTQSYGLPVGVLSNFWGVRLEDSLKLMGIAEFIDVACAPSIAGFSKPDSGAFLAVTKSMGVAPSECLFFDDQFQHVEGARAIGIRAYHVDRRRSEHALSEGVIRDLSALPTIFEESGLRPAEERNGR